MDIDRKEIRRYLGIKEPEADVATEQLMTYCVNRLCVEAAPKSVFRAFDVTHPLRNIVKINDLSVVSENLSCNLRDCTCVYLMAATLGVGVDRMIARASASKMSEAVVLQAAAAAMIETYCDEINKTLRQEAQLQGLYCRPRFSPGYGDFAIEHQRSIVHLLDAPRKIGLTVTESMMLAPAKSVTAVVGLSNAAQMCDLHGCEVCEKKNCSFRR